MCSGGGGGRPHTPCCQGGGRPHTPCCQGGGRPHTPCCQARASGRRYARAPQLPAHPPVPTQRSEYTTMKWRPPTAVTTRKTCAGGMCAIYRTGSVHTWSSASSAVYRPVPGPSRFHLCTSNDAPLRAILRVAPSTLLTVAGVAVSSHPTSARRWRWSIRNSLSSGMSAGGRCPACTGWG